MNDTLTDLVQATPPVGINLMLLGGDPIGPVGHHPQLHVHHKAVVEDDLVTGQKEKRIIGTLEPVMGRGALIVTENAVNQDNLDCGRYAPKDRQVYSAFHQMAKITPERGSLVHDDRLDSIEGAVRYWQARLAIDQEHQLQQERVRAHAEMIKDPLGKTRYDAPTRQAMRSSRQD